MHKVTYYGLITHSVYFYPRKQDKCLLILIQFSSKLKQTLTNLSLDNFHWSTAQFFVLTCLIFFELLMVRDVDIWLPSTGEKILSVILDKLLSWDLQVDYLAGNWPLGYIGYTSLKQKNHLTVHCRKMLYNGQCSN
jgi:hypothetical protein